MTVQHSGNQLRSQFLSFFSQNQHQKVKSASLLPLNDPTLFFVNAGMVPFKNIFLGQEKVDYSRATSSQKCMRVSGKHNDLENVGHTPRHHTFFEMLGNFSFGDYFKREAIAYAWQFLTEVLQIPKELLWVSVFHKDDQAYQIWQQDHQIATDRLLKMGEADNFWSMGATGPCGPCSEIYVDIKKLTEGKSADGTPETNDNDFIEVWNLVFMQYNRDDSGKLTELPKPSIDTGMGLERLALVMQQKRSNYETDLFMPLIQQFEKITGKSYGQKQKTDIALRVISDHLRAMVFLIQDGVVPTNEGRGYVLRRIMRRAIRYGWQIGQNKPFLNQAVDFFGQSVISAYPEVQQNQDFISKIIVNEEAKFFETLEKGLELIETQITKHKKQNQKVFDGNEAFKLYDTFGFPLDLTELIAREKGLAIDHKAFEKAMDTQKETARKAWKGSGAKAISGLYAKLKNEGIQSEFTGYQNTKDTSQVLALVFDDQPVQKLEKGQKGFLISAKTPFYAESGGQVGDTGEIKGPNGILKVLDTQKPVDGLWVHVVEVIEGVIEKGHKVTLTVDEVRRQKIKVNHSATHILNAALREILGTHVKQAGSLVDENRLRFDFHHFQALTQTEINTIQARVNEVIQRDYPVVKEITSYDEGVQKGALAFFGEKYGDEVRIVSIGPYSMEFCGGTHLERSGEVGFFKITSEASVSSGVRRIEAITGQKAVGYAQEIEDKIKTISQNLKVAPQELENKITQILNEQKNKDKEIQKLKQSIAMGSKAEQKPEAIENIKGVELLIKKTKDLNPKELREISDGLIGQIKKGILVLACENGPKIFVLIRVTKTLVKENSKLGANQMIQLISETINAKGGGKPEMVQAGGDKPEALDRALEQIRSFLRGL